MTLFLLQSKASLTSYLLIYWSWAVSSPFQALMTQTVFNTTINFVNCQLLPRFNLLNGWHINPIHWACNSRLPCTMYLPPITQLDELQPVMLQQWLGFTLSCAFLSILGMYPDQTVAVMSVEASTWEYLAEEETRQYKEEAQESSSSITNHYFFEYKQW